MNLNRNGVIETVGIMAVVLSLLFVAYEIRQSNAIAIGTTSYELSRNWMSSNELIITNPELRSLVVKLTDKDYVLTIDPNELELSLAYARRLLNVWIAIEDAHHQGIVSDAIYSLAGKDVISVLNRRPGLIPLYKLMLIGSPFDLHKYELLRPILLKIE